MNAVEPAHNEISINPVDVPIVPVVDVGKEERTTIGIWSCFLSYPEYYWPDAG